MPKKITDTDWFNAADRLHASDEVELDCDVRVSVTEGKGAWVRAWVWVPLDEVKEV